MKINSARIRSFGVLRDRDIEFDDRLTVIYGKNETGKTSLMEFIRASMYPGKARKTYPEYKSSDNGELDITVKSGKKFTVYRDGKKVKPGESPSDYVNIDSDLYRTVYAMSPEELRDSKIISSGDIKNRFLTVPGGEALPLTLKALDEDSKELLGTDRKLNKARITFLQSEIESNSVSIEHFRTESGAYSGLVNELSGLNARIDYLKSKAKDAASNEQNAAVLKSQEAAKKQLADAIKKREELSAVAGITDEVAVKTVRLNTNLDDSKKRYEAALKEEERKKPDTDLNIDRILEKKQSIEKLYGERGYYTRIKGKISEKKDVHVPQPEIKTVSEKKGINTLPLIAGAIILMATVAAGVMTGQYLLMGAGAAAFAVCAVLAFKGKKATTTVPAESKPSVSVLLIDEEDTKYIQDMDDLLKAVSEYVGLKSVSFSYDTDILYKILEKADLYEVTKINTANVKKEFDIAETEFNKHLAAFGGLERYNGLLSKREEYAYACSQVKALSETLNNGKTIEIGVPTGGPGSSELNEEISELSIKKGTLERRIAEIRKEGELEALMDREQVLTTELYECVKKWAMLSAAEDIINTACEKIYHETEPGVISKAGEFVNRMTGGRYTLQIDLQTNEVTVVSGGTGKREGEWSTGLGDQIYLAIKLAVAMEMSADEPVPILLDDVLQMFDSDRKFNACEMLAEASEDIQIIFFTCDSETRSMMESVGGCKIIEMPSVS